MNVFDKANNIAQSENKNQKPLIVFDEMGLAEISKNNPLKVLHSLLENDNIDVAFVGISNWRLDASKMNRGIFLSRPDLGLKDLEKTADIIFRSYISKEDSDKNYENDGKYFKYLAAAYYNYKEKLKKSSYPDFHGARDFYFLIKQVSNDIIVKKPNSSEAIFNIVELGLERNFQGLKEKIGNIKDEFVSVINERERYNRYKIMKNKYSTLDLVKYNLEDDNSRYLMLITKSDSASYILDSSLRNSIKERITFVGSKFEDDLNKEEYIFRTLSDIIMYMEKGWAVIMQDMDHIYGSLYDLFNQNFTIIGGNKKNCRIALGSVTNPMCFVHDKFHCIVILEEASLELCEPPFLNRFLHSFIE